ncbi:MAG: hypothetical protein B7Y00_08175 [Sphingomonadales bacterium 17-56-6]|nr:MAG: hypothetical protein B7Y00_08175 [Sphingomonadales bacterium 17-56-6]
MKLLHRSSHFVDATECDFDRTSTDQLAVMRDAFRSTKPSSLESVAMRSLGSVDECGCLALLGRLLIWASRNAR